MSRLKTGFALRTPSFTFALLLNSLILFFGLSGASAIEVLVKAGDTVEAEQPIVTLESDKASMDVPSPAAGKITEIVVKVGDKFGLRVQNMINPQERFIAIQTTMAS